MASEPGEERIRSKLIMPEWLEAGLIGALAVIVIFLARDLWMGEPLHTPSVLGTLLFEGVDAARRTATAPGAAAAYHALHFTAWIVVGLFFTRLMRRAEDDPKLWYLPLLGLAASMLAIVAADVLLRETALTRPQLWLGGCGGLAALLGFLLWRHPGVVRR